MNNNNNTNNNTNNNSNNNTNNNTNNNSNNTNSNKTSNNITNGNKISNNINNKGINKSPKKISTNNKSQNSIEKIFEKTLKNVLSCQDYAQVFIVISTRVKDVNSTIEAVHRAMEMQETCNLLKFFLVSNSPNLKPCIVLIESVAKTFLQQLYLLYKDPCCKEIIQKTINANKLLLKSLALLVKVI